MDGLAGHGGDHGLADADRLVAELVLHPAARQRQRRARPDPQVLDPVEEAVVGQARHARADALDADVEDRLAHVDDLAGRAQEAARRGRGVRPRGHDRVGQELARGVVAARGGYVALGAVHEQGDPRPAGRLELVRARAHDVGGELHLAGAEVGPVDREVPERGHRGPGDGVDADHLQLGIDVVRVEVGRLARAPVARRGRHERAAHAEHDRRRRDLGLRERERHLVRDVLEDPVDVQVGRPLVSATRRIRPTGSRSCAAMSRAAARR